MSKEDLNDFNVEIVEECQAIAQSANKSEIDVFTEAFISYISDNSDVIFTNVIVINYKKTREKIRINGYSINEFDESLTLFISCLSYNQEVQSIGKTKTDDVLNQAYRFYRYCREGYFDDGEEANNGYLISRAINDAISKYKTLNIVFLTNYITPRELPENKVINGITIVFDIWDIERIWQLISPNRVATPLIVPFNNKYNCKLPLIKVGGENEIYDSYVGVISGELLAKLYADYGQKLLEKNIRLYLQAVGKVNKGISHTLSKEPEMFMAYNNGISTIADSISTNSAESANTMIYIDEITGWQIVNGGQTTASLHRAFKNGIDLSNVSVQMKLTVIKNKDKVSEIVTNISKYANSQNEIKYSDFCANDDYHVEMYNMSRKVYVPVERGKGEYRWYYERARGQYNVELNRCNTPKEKKEFKRCNDPKMKVLKTVAARCLVLWRKEPWYVAKGLETNFVHFSELLQDGEIPAPSEKTYIGLISKVILFNNCDKIITDLNFGDWKAQLNYYTISLLAEFYPELVDDEYIWKHQSISPETSEKIEELAYKVWYHFMNPLKPGINVGQWCKKEECWTTLIERYKANQLC